MLESENFPPPFLEKLLTTFLYFIECFPHEPLCICHKTPSIVPKIMGYMFGSCHIFLYYPAHYSAILFSSIYRLDGSLGQIQGRKKWNFFIQHTACRSHCNQGVGLATNRRPDQTIWCPQGCHHHFSVRILSLYKYHRGPILLWMVAQGADINVRNEQMAISSAV